MSRPFDGKPKEKISKDEYKRLLEEKLERAGTGGLFLWTIFLICVTPSILNGYHVSSYTLLGHAPDDQWCDIADLKGTNWTLNEERSLSEKNLTSKGCTILDWDYNQLKILTFRDALDRTEQMLEIKPPKEIACKEKGSLNYLAPETTFVSDWELVCDREIQRTSTQMYLCLGKLFGSFFIGIISDTYGRKPGFAIGAVIFVASSLMCTFSPWFSLFLVGRFGLGASTAGLSYPTYTMVIENVALKHRSYMTTAFPAAYSVGLIILAAFAYVIPSWRYLQLALTVPGFLLIINFYFMKESAKWLIIKQRYDQAYKILFKQKSNFELEDKIEIGNNYEDKDPMKHSLWHKFKTGPMEQLIALFATRNLLLVTFALFYIFFVTSLVYYVTALNAPNLDVSRYLYVAITGVIDLPSFFLLIVALHYLGRRPTLISFFLATGVAFLIVLAVPANATTWILVFAMIGRLGSCASYSVIALYGAELYPTEIRNTALGTCFTWSHLGAILAPYIVDLLGQVAWYIPTTICGGSIILAAILALSLPETAKDKISDQGTEESQNDTESTTEEYRTKL